MYCVNCMQMQKENQVINYTILGMDSLTKINQVIVLYRIIHDYTGLYKIFKMYSYNNYCVMQLY